MVGFVAGRGVRHHGGGDGRPPDKWDLFWAIVFVAVIVGPIIALRFFL